MNRRLRMLNAIGVSGCLLVLVALTTFTRYGELSFWLAIAGFMTMFATGILSATGYLRCPQCDHSWTLLAMAAKPRLFSLSWLFTLDPQIKHCPFCGTDIDDVAAEDSERDVAGQPSD